MGGKKRKANNGPVKKESKYKIPRRFDCPVCDAKASIAVKVINREGSKSAQIKCRNCGTGDKDGQRPMLPLEKAVDAFFAFREELMEKDREYLESRGLDIGGSHSAAHDNHKEANTISATRAQNDLMVAGGGHSSFENSARVSNLAELERNGYGYGYGRNGRGSRRTAQQLREIDDDVADLAAQHFEPRQMVDSGNDEDADDYDGMFA